MQCITCGTPINNPKPDQKCCIACHYEINRIKSKKKNINKKSQKKTYIRECLTCSKEFQSEYKVEKFCSTTCRQHRADHKVNSAWLENPLPKKNCKNSFNKFKKYTIRLEADEYANSGEL